MSKKPPYPSRLNPEAASRLPWEAIREKLNARSISALESHIGVSPGTLSRVIPPSVKQRRGLSSSAYYKVLMALARKFPSSQDFRTWLQKYWPADIYEASKECIELVISNWEMDGWLPSQVVRPRSYVPRPDEEKRITEYLVSKPTAEAFYVSGIGGIGKTTLVAGTLYKLREVLKQRYATVIWVDEFSPTKDAIDQLVVEASLALDMDPTNTNQVRAFMRQYNTLVVLDGLHEVPDMRRVFGFVGSRTHVIVISRTKAASISSNTAQLTLQGLDKQQSLTLFENEYGRTLSENEHEPFTRIFQICGGHPLALKILGRLAAESSISISRLLANLDAKTFEVLQDAPSRPRRDTSVQVSFELTYEYLQEHHASAAGCFDRMGVFATPRSYVSVLEQIVFPDFPSDRPEKLQQILQRLCLLSIPSGAPEEKRVWSMHSLIHRFAQQKFANLDEETRSRLQKRHTDSFNTLGEDIAQSVMLGHNERKRMSIVFDDIVQAIETSLQWGEFSVALRLCDNMFTAASEVSMAGLESILKQLWGFAEKNDLLRRVEVRSTLKLRHATLLSYKYQWVDTLNLAEEVARDDPLDGMTEEESRRLHAIRAEAAMLAVIANAMSKDEHSPLDVLIEYSIKKASGIQPARKPVGLTDKQVEIYLEDAEAWIPYAGNILGNEDILTVYLLRAKAMWAFEQKKFRKSLGCFSEAVRKAKSAKHVLLAQLCSLGQVDALIELKRINEAVKLLQALLEGGFALEHPYYEAKLKLVNCFLQQGKQAAAVKILRTIDIALDGWDELKAQRALALSILGGILCSNGDVEEGIEKLLEAGNLWKALPGSENQQKRIADWLSYHTKHGL